MTVEILQINPGNIHILNHHEEEIFEAEIDTQRLAAMLAETNHILLVAVVDGRVIGQVLAVIHRHPDKPTELYIDDLAVSESVQRSGIATRLLKVLYALGVQRGCEEVWVATEPNNEAAIAFYRSMGLAPRDALVFEGYRSHLIP